MKLNTIGNKVLQVRISMTLTEEGYRWNSPCVDTNVDFSIPVDLMTGKLVSEYIEKTVAEMKVAFPEAAIEFEAEKAAKEAKEAEKENAEANG